jgi:hypothetical protein
MVNGALPDGGLPSRREPVNLGTFAHTQAGRRRIAVKRSGLRVFAQILGKLNFFKLGENLQRIFFDYAEKRRRTTNAAFKCTC